MANLLLDDSGRPKPQIENAAGTGFEAWKGENNAGRITGDIDHDAVDAGKPVKIGGKAADPAALPADVAAGDRVNALFDLKGRLFTRMDIAPPLPTGAATEAKQDAIIGYIDALETLLTAIKDTDGIKKITDALPAGNNTIGGVNIASEKTYSYANVTGDTQIKAGAGKLKRVIIGKVTAAGDLTLYDSTTESGTTIAVLSLEQTGNPRQIDFDIAFSTGLYIGFDAALAANITVIYE
jgi:hypothetical protein